MVAFKENKQFTQKVINNLLIFDIDSTIPRSVLIEYLCKVGRIKIVRDGQLWLTVRNLNDTYSIVECFDGGEDDINKAREWFGELA